MSIFEKNPKSQTPRISVGVPCKNCPHSHMDHSMYSPRLCYIEGCKCPGLSIESK